MRGSKPSHRRCHTPPTSPRSSARLQAEGWLGTRVDGEAGRAPSPGPPPLWALLCAAASGERAGQGVASTPRLRRGPSAGMGMGMGMGERGRSGVRGWERERAFSINSQTSSPSGISLKSRHHHSKDTRYTTCQVRVPGRRRQRRARTRSPPASPAPRTPQPGEGRGAPRVGRPDARTAAGRSPWA